MKAGIIAAGEGSRLRSEGIGLPKPLVPVEGTPLIERLIRIFIRHGISEIACIVNEYSLDVKRFVEECRFPVKISFVVKTTPSSMHSLFALAPLLRGERFLLSTVDTIFREDEFSSFLRFAEKRESADGVLAITNFIDDENPLYVQVDSTNRITGFSKSERAEWVTGGLYLLSPKIFKEIDRVLERGTERLRNFLGYLIQHGYNIEGFPFSKMIDIDHVQDIETARKWLAEMNLSNGASKNFKKSGMNVE
jgi:NDP-sugar pyrophosphorylase family protein